MLIESRLGRKTSSLRHAWATYIWTFSLLALSGCGFSDSRVVRHEVVIDGLVGTTMDADVFDASSVGVDFGDVRVLTGSEDGSTRFWPQSMQEDYKAKKGIAQCFNKSEISIKKRETGLYHIQASFLTPSAISGKNDHKKQAIDWLKKCDCNEEVGATCFEDYAIREIESMLKESDGRKWDRVQKASIPLADLRQMKRRLGTLVQTRRRIMTDELGVYQRRLGDNVIPHNIERLDPGKRICVQSYSRNYGVGVTGGDRISALVPGALSCMKWLSVVLPINASGEEGSSEILAGLDPITPLGEGWKNRPDNGEIYVKPVAPSGITRGLDYWAPLDRVVNNSESSFPFGLLFTSNYKRTILIHDTEDLNINKRSSNTVRRGNILLLFKNVALRDFVQQHYAFESSKGPDEKFACITEGTRHSDFYICVKELVQGWLDVQTETPEGDAEDFFHDLVIPSNIRPFTQIPIYLNGELRWIRTGVSLLSILDEKFRLSEEVMQARSAETGTTQPPPYNESVLIERALSEFSLKRRRAGSLVEIQMHGVQSLEGLAFPLAPGDELSWSR
ncbi:hypothetical protein ACP3VU_01170 [Vibrio sp. PNB23_22_6]